VRWAPPVGFRFTDRFSLEVGYRWLDLDYETGDGTDRFAYDVLTQGPVGGLAFRF
jgi:hypothetical protein